MNTMKLAIRNYQALKKVDIEFIPGINLIVGESYNGKSSISRAIETAIFNLSRPHHVTQGESKSLVGIRYKGQEVVWKRDLNAPSQVSYKVNGQILRKLGKGQPEEVYKAFGMREIDLDDFKMRLNFQKQMKYPFLLDKTPSQLFKFIVQSSEEDNLMKVIDDMKTDSNSLSATIGKLEASRDTIKVAAVSEVQKYRDKKPALPLCDEVFSMESDVMSLYTLEEIILRINSLETEIKNNTERLDKVKLGLAFLDKELPLVGERISKQESFISQVQLLDGKIRELQDLEDKHFEIESEVKKFDVLDDVQDMIEEVSSLRNKNKEFSILLEDLRVKDSQIRDKETNLDLCRSRLMTLKELDGIDLERLESLSSIILKCKDLLCTVENLENSISGIDKRLIAVQKEIQAVGICPYCNQKIEKEGNNE